MSGQAVGTCWFLRLLALLGPTAWRLGQSRVLLYRDPKGIMEEEMETTLYILGILITGMPLQPYGHEGLSLKVTLRSLCAGYLRGDTYTWG